MESPWRGSAATIWTSGKLSRSRSAQPMRVPPGPRPATNAPTAPGRLGGEPDGPVRALLAGGEDALRAVQLEQAPALGGRALRHHARERVALHLRDHREGDASVPARRLEELASRYELTSRLGVLDHRLRDTVLDRAGRVLALELRVDLDVRARREPLELDERRAADQVEHAGRDERATPGGRRPAERREPAGRDERAPPGGRLAAGHRREEDHGRALADRCIETLERPDVLVVQVHVDEGRDVPAVQDLRAEPGVAPGGGGVEPP